MELYLDDQKTETGTNSEATLAEVLNEIKQRLGSAGRIVVDIRCDGTDVTGAEFQETLAQPSSTFTRIDMHSADTRNLVAEALETAGTLLDESTRAAAEVVDLLSAGNVTEALPKLAECCRSWGQVHEGIYNSVVMLGLDVATFTVEGQSLPQILAVPNDQLRQLKEVIEAKDFVLLSDILSYEFSEAIDSWRKIKDALKERLN